MTATPEGAGRPALEADTPQTDPAATRAAFRVTRLIRGESAAVRHATAARRLIEVVQGLPAGCAVDITVGDLGGRGNAVQIEATGPLPDGLVGELRWAFDGVAEIKPSRAKAVPAPRSLAEIKAQRGAATWPDLDTVGDRPEEQIQAELLRARRLRSEVPWPRARYADLADLLSLNEGGRATALGLVLRYRLAPAGPIEQEIVTEQVRATWDSTSEDCHDYIGRAVRLRAFVGSTRGHLPGRVLATIRQWSSALDHRVIPSGDIEGCWAGDSLSLIDHAVPFGVALALVRVPAADLAFPGMPTTEPPVLLRPLDPVPAAPRHGIRIGRAKSASGAWVDVHLSLDDLTQHCFIQGSSGSGKSTLLAMIALAVQASGASYTLLDPEGSTVEAILRQTDRAHADRVTVVRHGHDDLDAPLNLLAVAPEQVERVLDLFTEMIQRAQDPRNEGIVGPRWRRWFSLIAQATVVHYGEAASLIHVAHIACDMERVTMLANAVADSAPELSHRLKSEYGALRGDTAADMVSWGVSKLGMLLTSERARWIFGAGPDAIDVRAAMDDGRSLLIDLGAHRLGEPVARVIGAVYLLKLWAALGERQNRDRRHYIIVDEAHLFSYGPLPKLLAEARKFGVGVIVATQHIGQLTGELGDALESNTGSFISLRSGIHSAARASTRLGDWPISELVRQPNFTAAASLTRSGIVGAPFSLVVDHLERIQRQQRAGRVGPAVATEITEACRDEFTSSYAYLDAPSDGTVLAALSRPRRRRPPRPLGVDDTWIVPSLAGDDD